MKPWPDIAHPAVLVAVEVPDDRSLRLVLEARTVRPAIGQRFSIFWETLVCVAIRGDPFPKGGPSTATITEILDDSSFLGWVRAESHAQPEYVAAMSPATVVPMLTLRHWQISTSDALFDVATIYPPTVQLLDSV